MMAEKIGKAMICGIGTDISEVKRFEKWVENPGLYKRFFNDAEIREFGAVGAACQHYAARFAAKEAFSKALGTGIVFDLKEVFVTNDELGKPLLNVKGKAADILKSKFGDCILHISLSHEKDYAIAFVIIERIVGGQNANS